MKERIFPTAISGLVQPVVDSVAARIHRRVAPTVTTVTRRIDRDSNRNPRHRGCWIRAKPIAKSPAQWRFRVDTRQRLQRKRIRPGACECFKGLRFQPISTINGPVDNARSWRVSTSQPIHRTFDAQGALAHHVQINHGR